MTQEMVLQYTAVRIGRFLEYAIDITTGGLFFRWAFFISLLLIATGSLLAIANGEQRIGVSGLCFSGISGILLYVAYNVDKKMTWSVHRALIIYAYYNIVFAMLILGGVSNIVDNAQGVPLISMKDIFETVGGIIVAQILIIPATLLGWHHLKESDQRRPDRI